MYLKISSLCFCAFTIIQTRASQRHSPHEVHKVMTMPELGFYFGTVDQQEVSEYQIVYMPVLMPKSAQNAADREEDIYEDEPIDYGFNVFGREVNLKLKPNRNLMSPSFKMHRWNTPEGDPEIVTFADNSDCHYLHREGESVAAISMCQDQIIHGLIFLNNITYEIRPLNQRLRSLVMLEEALQEEAKDEGMPHIVRRATVQPSQMSDDFRFFPDYEDFGDEQTIDSLETEDDNEIFREKRQGKASGYTVELAMFFDEAAYKIFAPYLNYNEKEMRDMLLAYMNGVQALYHHPSLGVSIELTLVRLDIMKSQPANMPHYNGERSKLLDSFCAYQKSLNPPGDSNPNHWDMALYISGLDFYAIEGGTRSGVTMGLATVGGVCYDQYACVIAELGTTNVFGRPYPSAGFTSVYILAHEIGHNLGMHHDSSGNSCTKEGYIMSPSRGTNGETIWSTCSANVMQNLGSYKCLRDKPGPIAPDRNHGRYQDTPGQAWGAKRQCEILLKDKDAHVSTAGSTLTNICQQLQCKTPHRSGFYYAGPALEGTDCGKNMWCQGGSCTKRYKKKPSVVQGGWSDWMYGKCNSGCIIKGKGFLTKQRKCDNPKPVNTEEGCEGNSYEVNICKDDNVCGRKRRSTIVEYASNKCREFSKRLPELDHKGAGLQAPHEESRLWMACAIFCRRADTGSYYTPRIDLNDLGVDPYFPDGTWCHNDGKENYFCLQHHCLPETFKFTKLWGTLGEDLQLLGNARPHPATLPPIIQKYLSLGEDGKPLLTSIGPEQNLHLLDDWTNHDYVDLPESFNKRRFDNNDA